MDHETTTKWVKRALKDDEGFPFGLVAADAEGKPVFLVGKLEPEVSRAVREARKTARDKRSAEGMLKRDPSGELVLAIQDGVLGPKVVQKIVRTEVATDPGFKVLKAILRNLTAVAEAKKVTKSTKGSGSSEESETSPSESSSDTMSDKTSLTTSDPGAALLEKIRNNLGKFEANPPAIDEEKLGKLLERIAEYQKLGGTEDVSGIEHRVRGELGAREVAYRAWDDVNGARDRISALSGSVRLLREKYAGDPNAVADELETIIERLSGYRDAIDRALHG